MSDQKKIKVLRDLDLFVDTLLSHSKRVIKPPLIEVLLYEKKEHQSSQAGKSFSFFFS
jgi:hypothetical protein